MARVVCLLLFYVTWERSAGLEVGIPERYLRPRTFNPHPYTDVIDPSVGSNLLGGPRPPSEQLLQDGDPRRQLIRTNLISDEHPYRLFKRPLTRGDDGRAAVQFPKVPEAANIRTSAEDEGGEDPNHLAYLPNQQSQHLIQPIPFVPGQRERQSKKYAFSYAVLDKSSGDDFSHSQLGAGGETKGEYRVKLPDGRLQVVSYTADHRGYRADVRYDQENQVDQPVYTQVRYVQPQTEQVARTRPVYGVHHQTGLTAGPHPADFSATSLTEQGRLNVHRPSVYSQGVPVDSAYEAESLNAAGEHTSALSGNYGPTAERNRAVASAANSAAYSVSAGEALASVNQGRHPASYATVLQQPPSVLVGDGEPARVRTTAGGRVQTHVLSPPRPPVLTAAQYTRQDYQKAGLDEYDLEPVQPALVTPRPLRDHTPIHEEQEDYGDYAENTVSSTPSYDSRVEEVTAGGYLREVPARQFEDIALGERAGPVKFPSGPSSTEEPSEQESSSRRLVGRGRFQGLRPSPTVTSHGGDVYFTTPGPSSSPLSLFISPTGQLYTEKKKKK